MDSWHRGKVDLPRSVSGTLQDTGRHPARLVRICTFLATGAKKRRRTPCGNRSTKKPEADVRSATAEESPDVRCGRALPR